MSNDSDTVILQNSLNDNEADATSVYFNDKNYAFITDSTSNSGSFSSGQIQFDLATLNSQSQWVSLQDGVIEFPVKTTMKVTRAAGGTTANFLPKVHSTIIKNGWHQFIDSAQMIINGQTIQSSQPYENVAASFRMLSSWSQDTLKKWGTSTGVALDDCTADSYTNLETPAANSAAYGLNNAVAATVSTTERGFDAVNNQSVLQNKGVTARSQFSNNDVTASTLQAGILGSSAMKTAGRSNVAYTAAGTNTVNTSFYSAFYMATVRIRDLFDINDLPLCKNLKGYIYLSFNSSQINLTGGATTLVLSSVSVTPMTGRTTPILINTNTVTGITPGKGDSTAPIIQVTCGVDATTTDAISPAGPLLTNARLLVPFFIANPKTDMALTNPSKFFTSLEKIVNPITCVAGGSVNYTITVGVPNARKLLLLPMWQNLGGSTYLTNPEVSPFDTVPATSGPFATLANLQVYLGNRPIYQYPIQYDFEQWVQENSQFGLNGASVNEDTSGLLSEELFKQNHRYYAIDLSRRLPSEDGSSKSVQVSFNNPSSSYGLKVIAIVWYEKQWVMNTATCQISSV